MTILGITRDVLEVLGKTAPLVSFEGNTRGHDRRRAVDFSKAKSTFGWFPEKKFRHSFPPVVRELAANWNAA